MDRRANSFEDWVRLGVLSHAHHKFLTGTPEIEEVETLTDEQAGALLSLVAKVDQPQTTYRLAKVLWERGADVARRNVAITLPTLLFRGGQYRDAGRIYLEALQRGYPVVDYRPRWDTATLASHDPNAAEDIRVTERAAYVARCERGDFFATWSADVDPMGSVLCRGVSKGGQSGGAVFDIWTLLAGDWKHVRRATAVADEVTAKYWLWSALIDDLLPGKDYAVALGFAHLPVALPTDVQRFHLPAAASDAAVTGAGDAIGVGGAFFSGAVSAIGRGAQYRFAYGNDPDKLDNTTPWEKVPPPRHAAVRDPAYRHFGHWIPRSTEMAWVVSAGQAALELMAPFAKDRNQLTGIGSHEMPLNFRWGDDPGSPRPAPSLSVDCGNVDLRDADVSFTLQGVKLQQRGAGLTFWINRLTDDAQGKYWSQWALTSQSFPDAALEDGAWHTVTLRLPDNPAAWTYTGNNPIEQGLRAQRYRRAPLHQTLSGNNDAFVLIFAFGPEREPPLGSLRIREIQARYRSHSILSHAFGSRLISWPEGSTCDPANLSNGTRGFDESLWISEEHAGYPLEFTWEFKQPLHLTKAQINQHPYWPARDVELWGLTAEGRVLLCSGSLSAYTSVDGAAPYARFELDEPMVSGVMLRIASGYHAERCGLDGLEVFARDAVYSPDGQSCSVSTEVRDSEPGRTIYFRSEVADGDDIFMAEVKSLTLPKSQAPILLSVAPLPRRNNPAALNIRANAMGLETSLHVERLQEAATVEAGPAVSLGSQPTARDIFYSISGEPAGRFRVTARNLAGEACVEIEFLPP